MAGVGEIFDTSSVALVIISSTNFSATFLQISSETDGCRSLLPPPSTVVTYGPFETASLHIYHPIVFDFIRNVIFGLELYIYTETKEIFVGK